MAETVEVPGIGKTDKKWVYAGAAVAIGIIGYAYWKNQQAQTQTDFVGASPDDFGVADYDSPLGNSGTNSTGDYTAVDPDTIDTNAEWTSAAVEKLSSYGWDSAAVASALGKYLSRQGLTGAQVDIVQAAVAAVGPVPVGGPYPINDALPETPGTGTGDPVAPDPVSGLRVFETRDTTVILDWDANDNNPPIGGYNVWWNNGSGMSVVKTQDTNAVIIGLRPGTSYTFAVEAYDPTDKITSPRREVTARTK